MSEFSSADRAAGQIEGELSSPLLSSNSLPGGVLSLPDPAMSTTTTTTVADVAGADPVPIESGSVASGSETGSAKSTDTTKSKTQGRHGEERDEARDVHKIRRETREDTETSSGAQPTPAAAAATTIEGPKKSPTPLQFKFKYQPHPFELSYYKELFSHALSFAVPSSASSSSPQDPTQEGQQKSGNDTHENDNDNSQHSSILPPKHAAKLFFSSHIHPEKLRMIWNMSTMPSTPIPSGTPPPPAMTFPQFCVAIRLIQLFQNKVTAKDDMLNVGVSYDGASSVSSAVGGGEGSVQSNLEEHVKEAMKDNIGPDGLVPAFFRGISGDIVKLPVYHDPKKPFHNYRRASTGSAPSRRSSVSSTSVASDGRVPNTTAQKAQIQHNGGSNSERGQDKTSVEDGQYDMKEQEILNYQSTFSDHKQQQPQSQQPPFIPVNKAVIIFSKSGLSRDTLGKLWDIVLPKSKASKLDQADFILMMHMIVCVWKRGLVIPKDLPKPLKDWRDHFRGEEAIKYETTVSNDANEGNTMEIRMKQMEQEIASLKKLIASLEGDVLVLKGNSSTKGANLGTIREPVNYVHTTEDSSDRVSSIGGGLSAVRGETDNRRGTLMREWNHGLLKDEKKESVSYEDDGPMDDVEVYWPEKKNFEEEPAPKPQPPRKSPMEIRSEGVRTSVSKFIPPVHPSSHDEEDSEIAVMRVPIQKGFVRRASVSSQSSAGSARSSVSNNIPSIHPSAFRARPPTNQQQMFPPSAPQDQGVFNPTHIIQQARRFRSESNASGQHPVPAGLKRRVSIDSQASGPGSRAPSVASQRGTLFNNNNRVASNKNRVAPADHALRSSQIIANKVLERLGGDGGSITSSNSSKNHAKEMRRSMFTERPRPKIDNRKLFSSVFHANETHVDPVAATSMHIKRGCDGKAQVYNRMEIKERSTKAVDLKPLEAPPITPNVMEEVINNAKRDQTLDNRAGLRSKLVRRKSTGSLESAT